MFEQMILTTSTIRVIEEYVYQTELSGIRRINLKEPKGLIEVYVHCDKRRNASSSKQQPLNSLSNELHGYKLGYLQVDDYGLSNINQNPGLNWDADTLPITVWIDPNNPEFSTVDRQSNFDLQLTDTYQPDNLKSDLLRVEVEIVDEDSIVSQNSTNSESHGKLLLEELGKQSHLKHSLTIKFQIKLELPNKLGAQYIKKPLEISRVALGWPLATPHHLARIRSGIKQFSFNYDPECKIIYWGGVVLKPPKKLTNTKTINFTSDVIQVVISDPTDFYEQMKLSGFIEVEIKGLLSGANLRYTGPSVSSHHVVPTFHTILVNEFTINLRESVESKLFSPRQQLYFPGVILDEMRIADILMLLEDRGFEIKRSAEYSSETGLAKKRYEIDAERFEGVKSLKVNLRIEGIDANTTRERNILGKAKYTTDLLRGDTNIYIMGQMYGDSKRVVTVINEIQKQLREQFRHVGTAE